MALPTTINPRNLALVLRGYCDASKIVSGFTHGFTLHCLGPCHSYELNNSASVRLHSDFLSRYVSRELHMNRIAGPFQSPPFSQFVVSPIAIVPKKGAWKFPGYT